MARLLLEQGAHHYHHFRVGSIPLAIALFISVSAIVALCAKHSTRRTPQEHDDPEPKNNNNNVPKYVNSIKSSPLPSPKKLVARISNKATDPFKKRSSEAEVVGDKEIMEGSGGGSFGEGGLWQKSILMGEKCRPPEFSGVIYYDSHGNQTSEMPRSPRASPLPSFSFPVAKDINYS